MIILNNFSEVLGQFLVCFGPYIKNPFCCQVVISPLICPWMIWVSKAPFEVLLLRWWVPLIMKRQTDISGDPEMRSLSLIKLEALCLWYCWCLYPNCILECCLVAALLKEILQSWAGVNLYQLEHTKRWWLKIAFLWVLFIAKCPLCEVLARIHLLSGQGWCGS